MWRPLRGLFVDVSPEMPHAEKNFSHHVHDSSIEPCLKKSRPDYSSSWPERDTDLYKEHEAKSQKWSFSTSSEQRRHQPDRGDGGIHARYDSELLNYHSGKGDANRRDCNKTSQRSFVPPERVKPEYKSDVAFSGTSTSFIGPLYQPSPQEKSLPEVTSNENTAPYQIATVELGKSASQSKGRDGMDYELRQFYKELNELEAEADDQTEQVTDTDVDIEQRISVNPDKTPATHPANYQHGQVPTSQPFGPFPSTPPNLVSLTCPAKEDARPPLPPNNPFSCDGQAPYHPTNSSFVSHAIPPPSFDAHHPPTFIIPYGPPPPRFNYPMTFPRPSNALPPPSSQNLNYNTRNERPSWHGSPVPPESRFISQGGKPFPQSTGERPWQDLQYNEICGQEDGQFGERILPYRGDMSHEQYRFRDKRTMVLLRGVPGSGKSTLARTLLQQSPDGIVLSTDDYFCQENGYTYDVKLLGDAHSWNQNRARRALDDGRSPVIIDNTNIQGWEMKPYVQMAVDRGYDVKFMEPDTWWKQDAHELEKRNTHRVPREKISQMLERFEYDMTVPVVMSSVEPRRNRPNRPPPEARPRTDNLKEKHHRKRNRKNGRKIGSRKHSLSPQEDEGLENLAAEEKGSGYDVGNCRVDAEGIGKMQVKIISSGRGRYLSDYLAAFLSHRSNRGAAALFGLVSRLMALMDSPVSQSIPKTETLVAHRQCLLSSSLGGMLYKDTQNVRPFFNWLQACSKGLHVTDQARSRCPDMKTSLDLCCSLITFLAGQTLHLYGMKCFKFQNVNCPKNQLTYRVSENQDEKSKQKYCERFKDPYLETEISNNRCVHMMDTSKIHVETKLTPPRRQKRLRKVYKLAPTFQNPRILSATQIRTWKNSCGDGASNRYTEADAAQNPLENNHIGKLITDDLTRRERRCRAKDESVCQKGIYEDDLYPATFKCPDGHEHSEVKRSYSDFLPGAQSCDRLCLPEQFARQLVELFGCPGVEFDAFQPKDFIVPLGYDLARVIYIKWKTSLEVKYKLLPGK